MSEIRLPPRVLFVDDDRSMRVAFANAARAFGIEAVVVESGGKALEVAHQTKFPVVVTDLSMPGIDGIGLRERLAALDPTAAFLIVSGALPVQAELSGLSDAATAGVLAKPLRMSDLRLALGRAYALHERRKRRAERAPPTPLCDAVLVVEDSPGDALLLSEYLSDAPGLAIVSVGTLEAALAAAHDREFDAIITDLHLPDARGLDAVLRLQASAPRAAILVYSGTKDDVLALQVVQVGAQDFLVKGATTKDSLVRSLRFARERKRAELRLRRLAHFDQLTGLANRASFDDALASGVARAERHHDLAVIMIDLDGFKHVNDTLGHQVGDQVLQEVGVRLRCLFREYDHVARFGGDEFAVMLTDVRSLAILAEISERLLVSLDISVSGADARVTGSIGIATFPDGGRTPASLLRSADRAMYASKRAGRNRFTVFHGAPDASSLPPPGVGEPVAEPDSETRILLQGVPEEVQAGVEALLASRRTL